MTDHPREVVEAALVHVVRDKVEAAYAKVGPVRAAAADHERLGRVPRRPTSSDRGTSGAQSGRKRSTLTHNR